jgi:sortase A
MTLRFRVTAGRMSAVAFVSVTAVVAVAHPAVAAATRRPIGRIVIPAIGVNTPFANGQAAEDTAFAPSHYPSTAMPGHRRTVAIAGHRVTHTHPFRRLAELRRGDLIDVHFGRAPSFPEEACYRVRRMAIVRPTDVAVIRDVGFDRLVLTTCHPPGSARYRLVVTARRAACRA